jgi:ribonuclease E
MAKRMLIDAAHPEETRVVVLNGHRLEEFDFETSTKRQIKGNIYLAKITRVEPSLQAAFVEYGGNRHGFLAFNEIHPDYYRIPVSDRHHGGEQRHEPGHDPARGDEDEDRDEGLPPFDEGPDAAPEIRDEGDDGSAVPGIAMPIDHRGDVVYDAHDADEAAGDGAAPDEPFHGDDPFADHEARPVEPVDVTGAMPPSLPDPLPAASDNFGLEPAAAMEGAAPADASHEAAEGRDYPAVAPLPAHHGEDAAPAEIIETVGGGDEIEEAPRQRARPYRHYKIQEVIKRRQIMLVQVTKEERGNKGAALTTFLSLAGRYCVLMPNTPRGGGVSRKITSITDRRRLKDLMSDLEVPDGMGVIVRTAGSERSKAEIKRDFEYLLRLWDDIRDLTLKSTAPALIYEEGNLIKRSIRDLYARDIDDVIVDGEEGYRTAKAFMKMLMPSHAKRVKPYRDGSVPLFHRFQVEGQIDAIHSPVVQLRSGGYIVINPTEALVAIDVNSGRSTKERNIEETALKTNLEAAEEIARQLRLRDLAGLIVIDFIDMEEHRHQAAVERKLKDSMRHDRARIQLGRISAFGLLELSRQRLRPSLLEASTQPCPHCNGSGHIRSTESTALHVLRAVEEEGMRRRSAEISVAVPTAVALYILNHKRDALVQIEARYGFRVVIGSDDTLVPPAFRLERLRALTPAEIAALPLPVAPPIEAEDDEFSADEADEEEAESSDEAPAPAPAPLPVEALAAAEEAGKPQDGHRDSHSESHDEAHEAGAPQGDGGRRRRRRRRRGGRRDDVRESSPAPVAAAPEPGAEPATSEEFDEGDEAPGEFAPAPAPAGDAGDDANKRRRRRGRRGGRRRRRGEGGKDDLPGGAEDQPMLGASDLPVEAERIEYVSDEPHGENAAAEMVDALAASPGPAMRDNGAESVPVADPGDHLEEAPPAAPAHAAAADEAPAASQPPAHDVTGPPANPKKGWWRRVMDS